MEDNHCQKLHLQRENKLAMTAGISELHDGSPERADGNNTWPNLSDGRRSVDVQELGGQGRDKAKVGKQQRPVRIHSCVTFSSSLSLCSFVFLSALHATLQSWFSYAASFLPAPPLLSASLFWLSGLWGSLGQTELSLDVITASQTEGEETARKEHGKPGASQP